MCAGGAGRMDPGRVTRTPPPPFFGEKVWPKCTPTTFNRYLFVSDWLISPLSLASKVQICWFIMNELPNPQRRKEYPCENNKKMPEVWQGLPRRMNFESLSRHNRTYEWRVRIAPSQSTSSYWATRLLSKTVFSQSVAVPERTLCTYEYQ